MSKTFTANAKKVTFSDAKVGDRVWSLTEGWGVVTEHSTSLHYNYPLAVGFENGAHRSYTLWGLSHINDLNPTLFWDEVKVEIPEKPLPQLEVDTKVIVWNRGVARTKRHFSHFSPEGKIVCFSHGLTSWTTAGNRPEPTTASKTGGTTEWNNWELAD